MSRLAGCAQHDLNSVDSVKKSHDLFTVLQPVAEEPFTFEMELDDLPKERLKEMIWQEINMLNDKNQQGMV